MRRRNGLQFERHLNIALAENPFFDTLFKVLGEHVDATFGEQLARLSSLRSAVHVHRDDWITHNGVQMRVAQVGFRVDGKRVRTDVTAVDSQGVAHTFEREALHERTTLINSARQLGFDYYSDTLSDMSYVQLIEHLAAFWPTNGSSDFVDFIGYIKGVRLTSEQLWGDDRDGPLHTTLEPYSPNMISVLDGGAHYPASHYQLVYNYLDSATVDLNDLVKLFYVFAPINFVLLRLVGSANADAEALRTVPVAGGLVLSESATLDFNAPETSVQDRFAPPVAHVVVIEHGVLHL